MMDAPSFSRAELRRGVMGKYAGPDRAGFRFVELDADVARVFKSSESVNVVLRSIIRGFSASQRTRKSA